MGGHADQTSTNSVVGGADIDATKPPHHTHSHFAVAALPFTPLPAALWC
jgi:hypothetical protein